MIVYLDSSAITRLLLRESGWEGVALVWGRATESYTSIVTQIECRAAVLAAIRSKRLPRRARDRVVKALATRLGGSFVLGISDELASAASDLAERHGLRAVEAIHLASALVVALDEDAVLVTSDRRLALAASQSGVRSIGIN